MSSKIYNALQLIRKGHFIVLLNEFKKRIYSRSVSIGLQRDLNDEYQAPSAKIDIQVRKLRKEDVAELLDPTSDPTINPRIIANQLSMVNANIPTCFVAVTTDDKPCYMQWLIGNDKNQDIEKHFKGVFPALKKSEALLEGAYSNPAYRGLRIMPMAMALIAEKATEINARWVNTFVDVTNIPSLKGCQRSGFKPYLIRKDHWFLFQLSSTFHPITDTMDNHFYVITDSVKNKPSKKSQIPETKHTPKLEKKLSNGISK
ncbi:MAG: hypothetical protein CL666_03980 [Balneola sp.]|nr:hypothetical protein [Balneola sp.]|tara:strand:+ start:39520 stop:40296 length:777 start_codon:yes stop_codon:yes gene_type:complete